MSVAPDSDVPRPNAQAFFDVRMRGFRDRADVDDMLALLKTRLRPLHAETVNLSEAAGRVLATDVISEVAVPAFVRSAMDGYALQAQETFSAGPYNLMEFEVVGASLPGRPFSGRLQPNQAVRIMTGAPLPGGADAVLQAEAAEEVAGRLRVSEAVPPGRNVGHL